MSEQNLTLDIDDLLQEQPAKPDAKNPQQPAPAKPSARGEPDAVATLSAQLAAAKSAAVQLAHERNAAIAQAHQRAREAQAARASQQVSQYDLVVNALGSARREIDGLKDRYQTAFEAGDAKTVASIQADMALIGGRINQLEVAKGQIEDRAARKARQRS